MQTRGKLTTEAERREIQRVAAAWHALHDWPRDQEPMTKDDVRRCGRERRGWC